MLTRLIAVLLAFAAETLVAHADQPTELLLLAVEGNRSAIESIRTMECRYTRVPVKVTDEYPIETLFHMEPGRFWKNGDVFRHLKIREDGRTVENLHRDGKTLTLGHGGPTGRRRLGLDVPNGVDGIVGGTLWQYLKFTLWGRNAVSFVPFWEMVQQPHKIEKVERLASEGNAIRVILKHDHGKLDMVFDPRYNYLARRVVTVPPFTNYREEVDVVEFTEGSPGVFVPTIIEHRQFKDDRHQGTIRTIVSDLKVNQPLSGDSLRLPEINGMICVDWIRNVRYRVNAEGKQTGPDLPLEAKIRTATESASPPHDSPPVEERPGVDRVSSPPTPLWGWILVGSLVILMSGLVLQVVRKVRTPRET